MKRHIRPGPEQRSSCPRGVWGPLWVGGSFSPSSPSRPFPATRKVITEGIGEVAAGKRAAAAAAASGCGVVPPAESFSLLCFFRVEFHPACSDKLAGEKAMGQNEITKSIKDIVLIY